MLIVSLFVAICLVFVGRIIYLKVNAPEIEVDSGLSTRTLTVKAMRGEIYDRNGNKLVSNSYSYNVYLDAGNYPKTNKEINTMLISLLDILPETKETVFPLENDYPSFTYKKYDKSSSEYKSFDSMLEYFSLENDIEAKDFSDFLLERYGLINKNGKLTVKKENIKRLLEIRYEIERLEFSTLNPFTISENVSQKTITLIKEANLAGVEIEKIPTRIYNYPGHASHILGRTGKIPSDELEAYIEKGYAMDSIVGIEGAEKAFEDYLHGVDGVLVIVEDKEGNIVDEYYKTEPISGKDVYLTIDIKLQIASEKALEENIAYIKEKAEKEIEEEKLKYTDQNGNLLPNADIPQYIGEDVSAGAATLVNPNNGEVFALASYPTFDLTTYLKEYNNLLNAPNKPLYNRALNGVYEPGSTFKVGVAAAALEYGVINTNTTIYDTGVYKYFNDFQPTCWVYSSYNYGHGNLNVVSAIQHSCNYFFYETGRLLTIEKMNEYTKQLGLGEYTGIELKESKGVLAGPEYSSSINKTWVPGDTIQAAIGQSDNTFTPLQISQYISTLINGGNRYKAHILHSVYEYGKGKAIHVEKPTVLNTVSVSDTTLKAIKTGMKNALRIGSAASVFSNYPIDIAGKTGTAQVGKNKSNNGLFVAFAPYDKPEIVATCIIEQAGKSNDVGVSIKRIFNTYFNVEG